MSTLPAVTTSTTDYTPATTSGTPWATVVKAFLTNASRSGSENTRRAYLRQLTAFAEGPLAVGGAALPPVRVLEDVTAGHLMAWREYVMGARRADGKEWTGGTRAQAIAALRSFMRWAGDVGLHEMPSDTWRRHLTMPPSDAERPFSVLSDAEVVRLMDAAAAGTTPKGAPRSAERRARDSAIVAVMLGAGLRAAEVVALTVRDVTAGEGGTVLAVRGKGGKSRAVPVREDVAAAVLRYLHVTGRRLGDAGALFVREGERSGKHLTTRTIGMLTAGYAAAAGIEQARAFSPHACRHTYAVRAARGGASVEQLRRLLGHSSVSTTGKYLDHLSLADLRDAVPALPTRDALR